MRKLLWLLFGLALASLACQALVPTVPPATPQLATQPLPITPTDKVSISTQLPTEIATSTPRPTPKPIVCADDTCLSACLEHINDTLPQTSYQALSGAYAENNINVNLVLYDVRDGQLGEPQFLYVPDDFKALQQDTVAHHNAWAYAASLLPPDQLKWISQFEIFSSTYYAGKVTPGGVNQHDRSHWILTIDIAKAQDPIGFTYVIVHEYAHLISLNTDQIPASDTYYSWSQNPAVCPQLISPEGCNPPGSYLNLFYQKFWKNIFKEWQEEVERAHVNTPDEFYGLVDKFYEDHPDQFIRDYAATNIEEDLAESFTAFVLEPKPSHNSIMEQKIKFFYRFPELVELRKQMIQSVCSYIGP